MEWVAFWIIFWVCWYVGGCFNRLDKRITYRIDSLKNEMQWVKELCEYLREERNNSMDEAAAWKKDCEYFQDECTKLEKKLQKYQKKSWKSEK